jgi:hypothetical protein
MCVSLKDAYISYTTVMFTHIVDFDKIDNVCMISGFRHGVNEIRAFWDFTNRRMVVSYRLFGIIYRSRLDH